MTRSFRNLRYLLATSCVASLCLLSFACEAKKKSAPAEPAPVAEPAESPPLPIKPTAPLSTPASEEERALAKAFIVRLTDSIESGKSEGWAALHTKARQESLAKDNAVEQSYQAWSLGTETVVHLMRTADFKLEKSNGGLRLTFESIMVPNDPETAYSISVAVEDGQVLIDEN